MDAVQGNMAEHHQQGSAFVAPGPHPNISTTQMSLSPAIETTVVTTTTTKTISYPPFVIKAPKNLNARDPETYPFAAQPTPAALRKLRFRLGSSNAELIEAEELENGLDHYKSQLMTLQAAKGSISSIQSTSRDSMGSKPTVDLPALNGLPKGRPDFIQTNHAASGSATPLSLPDDVDSSVAMENLDVKPPLWGRVFANNTPRKLHHRSDSSTDAARPSAEPVEFSNEDPVDGVPLQRPFFPHGSGTFQQARHPQLSRQRTESRPRPFTGSSTPPQQDFEDRLSIDTAAELATRPGVPPAVDTDAQDASLPSPSLSPITAAAQMNRALPTSKLRQAEYFNATSSRPTTGHADRPRPSTIQSRSSSDSFRSHEAHVSALDDAGHSPASVADIGRMLDTFDAMPENLQTYVMYQFLRRCSKNTLVVTSRAVAPALQVDFLKRLPAELTHYVIQYLDRKSLCRAAQVSKTWRQAVDSDEKAWSDLIVADGFKLSPGEVERAINEGWGWQFPRHDAWVDRDLQPESVERSEQDFEYRVAHEFSKRMPASAGAKARAKDDKARDRKRKRDEQPIAFADVTPSRKRRRTETIQPGVEWPINWDKGFRPKTFADAAACLVPPPSVGMRSLRNLHLFKSIYRRQFLMRRSWLNPKTKPKHIAFKAHEGHVVTCLQFDNDKILTGSDDAIIDIYDTNTGARTMRLNGHDGGVWALEYQDNILVSGSTDRSVRIWDMNDGECLHVFQGHTSTVRCLQIVEPVKTGTTVNGEDIMTPPHRLIITGSRDSSCRIWRLPNPGERRVVQAGPPLSDLENPYFVRALTGHTHSVRAIAAHADTLVSGSYDGTVRVWKISTGETVHRLSGHTTKVYSVVLDHVRKRCISGSMDTIVKVWSTETGECLFNLSGHQSLVGLLDLKDDILVSAAADFTLKVWNPESGLIQHTLKAHTGAITCFAHDGNKVISGSERTLKMWDIKTGEYVKDLLTDLRGVWQVRFDERRCVAAVHRDDFTYIEILDFGAAWDRVPLADRGRRIVVDKNGVEIVEEPEAPYTEETGTSDDEADGGTDDGQAGEGYRFSNLQTHATV